MLVLTKRGRKQTKRQQKFKDITERKEVMWAEKMTRGEPGRRPSELTEPRSRPPDRFDREITRITGFNLQTQRKKEKFARQC